MYYCPISTILKAMALEPDVSSRSESLYVSYRKEASTLSTLHEIANCVNNKKNCILQLISVSHCLQCCSQLLSVKLDNLPHSIFRNENSTLEINVTQFGVLHWQQWQPFASTPGDGAEAKDTDEQPLSDKPRLIQSGGNFCQLKAL